MKNSRITCIMYFCVYLTTYGTKYNTNFSRDFRGCARQVFTFLVCLSRGNHENRFSYLPAGCLIETEKNRIQQSIDILISKFQRVPYFEMIYPIVLIRVLIF